MSTEHTPEAAVVLKAGRDLETAIRLSQQEVRYVHGQATPFILGADGRLHTVEHLLDEPLRIQATPQFPDLASFCAYVNRYKNALTTIFANRDGAKLTAWIDYHGNDVPSRETHSATLNLKVSEEWKAWLGKDGVAQTVDAFAAWIEAREIDILSPSSASILEAARDLKLSRDGSYERKVNETNGSMHFVWKENIEEKGTVKLATEWTVALRPYEHCDPVPVKAKIQYRLGDGGKITFAFKLQRPDLVVEAAFGQIVERVKAETHDVSVYYGTP